LKIKDYHQVFKKGQSVFIVTTSSTETCQDCLATTFPRALIKIWATEHEVRALPMKITEGEVLTSILKENIVLTSILKESSNIDFKRKIQIQRQSKSNF